MTELRDDGVFVSHIRDAIDRISSSVQGVSEAEFMSAPLIQDAVIRQIQIVGEAAKKLSSPYAESSPSIAWKDIAGMRDKLVHDHMGVDLAAVWDKATRDIPNLKTELERLGSSDTESKQRLTDGYRCGRFAPLPFGTCLRLGAGSLPLTGFLAPARRKPYHVILHAFLMVLTG
jgi:uncharacterized protein with HEPN domain